MAGAVLVLLLLLLPTLSAGGGAPGAAVRTARETLARARDSARASMGGGEGSHAAAWADCVKLYEEGEQRLSTLVLSSGEGDEEVVTWLSGALTGHITCIDGLMERNASWPEAQMEDVAGALRNALAVYALKTKDAIMNKPRVHRGSTSLSPTMLESWDSSSNMADAVVAQDGSGGFRTIGEAVDAVIRLHGGEQRTVIYVKSGVYAEYVDLNRTARNLMLVGDGIDKTVVTGSRSVRDGFTTYGSSTFAVSGDGFWARGMTFENTAGPEKHQAVALRSSSDRSVFYRCSFKGYQDTLLVHSHRQFYRDCDVHGTVDFIFGNAAAVLQNCTVRVRRPMDGQANVVTAQGRDDPNENTGISVHASRVVAAPELEAVKGSFKSYLGRPWKEYSRTVFLKTDLDGLVDPDGWTEWSGRGSGTGLDKLYYGEYNNTGEGAATGKRVGWPGFHLISDASEAQGFTVGSFIQGDSWIPESGVPAWYGL